MVFRKLMVAISVIGGLVFASTRLASLTLPRL